MDIETIKRINRTALDEAKAALGEHGSFSESTFDNNQMLVYFFALAVAVVVYFLLQKFQPNFVTSTVNGVKSFDSTRAVISSIIAGLLVILLFHLSKRD
jgi:hypothetical protein